MEITEVKVFPVSEDKLKAFVSIVLDACFMVNDIKVIRGKDGLFISMPSRKKKNGEFKDVAHPLNNETRRAIEVRVLDEYERVLVERGESLEVGRRRLRIDGHDREREPFGPGVESFGSQPGRREAPAPAPMPAAAAGAIAAAAADGDSAGRPEPAEPQEDEEGAAGKSLEEVQELHLRDSFWSVT
jgi:stage V sporulation protein G